jgi:hypothetical protein
MPKRSFKDSSREALLIELIIAPPAAKPPRRHPMRYYGKPRDREQAMK